MKKHDYKVHLVSFANRRAAGNSVFYAGMVPEPWEITAVEECLADMKKARAEQISGDDCGDIA